MKTFNHRKSNQQGYDQLARKREIITVSPGNINIDSFDYSTKSKKLIQKPTTVIREKAVYLLYLHVLYTVCT